MTRSFLAEMGKRLRERRQELHLTQNETAELLEISLNFYGDIERGKRRLSLERVVLCHDRLGLDPTYLLTGVRPIEIGISNYLKDCPQKKRFDLEQLIKYACNLYK